MRFGDWKCGNAPACRYPNHAYRDTCKQCEAHKANAKWELPQDPRTTTCACGAIIVSHYTKNCRTCQAPILRPDGGAAVYDSQGDKPLLAPNRGGNLQSHSAEPTMLWTEAILNPTGPPKVSGDWPEVPDLHHIVAYDKGSLGFKVPYTTSNDVARAWGVDRNALCGKLLGHRRRKWRDTNPPALLPLAHGELALCAAGNGPHAGLVRPAHCLQWNPGGRKHHPRHVEARGQDAGLPNWRLRKGRHAPLRVPMAPWLGPLEPPAHGRRPTHGAPGSTHRPAGHSQQP